MNHIIRGDDTIARLGGDEFVLLFGDLKNIDEMETILQRVLNDISAPYQIDSICITISASIGVALFPFDDADADTLLRHADHAMYQAKQRGRNQTQFFDVGLETQIKSTHQMVTRVTHALRANQFTLHYQPKVNMRTGAIIGMEALLRWNHPVEGIIPPLEFLPQVEQTDLIVDIGEWVIEQALQQATLWQAAGRPWVVSVNIAAHHFQNPGFLQGLESSLARHPEISPERLEIEILESVALTDINHVNRLIDKCHALGVQFSIDDFGTGYSSLNYLKRLPARTLKIDQSFVRDILDDMDDLAMVEAVIGMGRVFKRSIIAEGVETSAHGILLMRLGCDQAQGYGIARPMPANKVLDWANWFKADPAWALWADKQWDLQDLPLLVVQHDQLKWVKQLIMGVDAETLSLDDASHIDPRHCRFGLWYDSLGKTRYGSLPEFKAMRPIHHQVHAAAQVIVQSYTEGNFNAAKTHCEELLHLHELFLEKIYRLHQAVITHYYP